MNTNNQAQQILEELLALKEQANLAFQEIQLLQSEILQLRPIVNTHLLRQGQF